MGAKVGSGCTIDTAACSIFDLVTIGDETSIGSETQIPCFRIEDGMLILGSVEIGKRCFIGIHSHLGLNTKMEDDSRLDDLSLLPDGEVIGRGEGRRGSPAESAQVSVPEVEAKPSTRGKRVLFGFYHYLITYMMEIALLLTALPSLSLLVFAYTINDYLFWALCIAAAIPLFEVSFCIGLAVAKAVVLRRLKPGIYSLYSLTYLRKWFVDCLMNISRLVVLPVYTTLYLPPWLRLLGAKLGKRVELSIVTILSPELLVTEEECFFADGSIVGGNRFHRGHVQVSENRVGRRSFIGNEAILPTGKHVGRNSLIGVLSAPPAEFSQAPDGTDWLGSPSFQLPHRLKVAAFDDTVTYSPSKRLVMQRWLVDSMRILIPSLIEIITLIAFLFLLYTAYVSLPGWALILTAPLIAMACIGIAVIGVVLVKNLFIGKFEPVIKPLWSMFVWLNEVVNGAYESIAAPVLSPLLGTPFFAPYLRLLGCRVGKDVYIGTTLFGEFDLVEIGDYAALDSGAIVQNHLFEDRVFKASHVRIGDECTVGAMSVVLYDTLMGSGSSIGPLSLLMKGETLPPRTAWQGIPTGVRELMRSDDHKAETRSARQETQREEALVS
jgi:non-ribosomal peptide synthetase-like protein